MFNYKHYVPVLRWKRAESVALRELDPNICHLITPLIEIPSAKFANIKKEDIRQAIEKICNNMHLSWENRHFFLDVGHLIPAKQTIAEKIIKKICGCIKYAIPVINLHYPESIITLISSINTQNSSGICLRLKKDDTLLADDIKKILKSTGISCADIDLIVDLEMIDKKHPSFLTICSHIPYLSQWRTFTIISGSFPQYLTGIQPGQHKFGRKDWLTWQQEILNNQLARKPSFGDYTIQYPYYIEPPPAPNATASIRYAASKYWVIMRGESLKKKGCKQWIAQAVLLSERPEFCGQDFSYGDRYIFERGQLRDKTGSLETWLRAGINHHLTFAAHQISNFSAS